MSTPRSLNAPDGEATFRVSAALARRVMDSQQRKGGPSVTSALGDVSLQLETSRQSAEPTQEEGVEAVRLYISELVYGFIAQAAYAASGEGARALDLGSPSELSPELAAPLTHHLDLAPSDTAAVLAELAQELYDGAQRIRMEQRWGCLRADRGRLVVELPLKDAAIPSGDRRNRARVVGGTALE